MTPRDVFEQMALDEAILDHSPAGSTVLRFYRWSAPAVTFGYGQSFELASALAGAGGTSGISLARRPTGGGLVFHDGDVTFSLVFDWPRLVSPEEIYGKIHGAVGAGLRSAGFPCRLAEGLEPAAPALAGACFTGPQPLDLIASGRKALGGALRRRGERGLYQGSLRPEPWGADPADIERAAEKGLAGLDGYSLRKDLEPEWIKAAEAGASRYRSPDWNRRR